MTVPGDADLAAAVTRLRGLVRRTPVLDLAPGDLGVPARITLKLESLQHTGSFKARGALNAVLTTPAGTTAVVAASGGNHGAAVAWAARSQGLAATVFVPAFATAAKVAAIESYGAQIHLVDGYYADALDAALAYAAERDLPRVDAYDATAVVAGQSTLGAELAGQVPAGQPVLVGCGGGGLFAGVTLALAGRHPVVAVEPEAAPTLTEALRAGEPVDVAVTGGIARDSLGARRAGSIAVAVALAHEATTLLVDDDDIAAAQRLLWDRVRVVAEPGGAAALAAVLRHGIGPDVTVVVSGGNVDR